MITRGLRPHRPLRRHASVAGIGVAVLVALAGCGTGSDSADDAAGTSTAAPTTVPTTAAQTTPAAAPAPQPVTSDGPCPYLEQAYIVQTVGQKVGRVEVTSTEPPVSPLPTCTFHALDDEPAVVISTEQYSAPAEAQAAALAKVGAAGNPVTTAGDGGAVLAADGQTICAVSKGTAVLVVTINQESSLEGEEIAGMVVGMLP